MVAILTDETCNNNDKGTGRTTDKEVRTTKERDKESRYDSCDKTLLWSHTTGNTEGNCQRKGDDTYDDAGNHIRHEGLLVVMALLKQPEKFRLEYFFQVKVHSTD